MIKMEITITLTADEIIDFAKRILKEKAPDIDIHAMGDVFFIPLAGFSRIDGRRGAHDFCKVVLNT